MLNKLATLSLVNPNSPNREFSLTEEGFNKPLPLGRGY